MTSLTSTDVLSDVLRAVRLTGAVYFDFTLGSPWVKEAPPSRDIARYVMPGAERVIEYHLVARGSCWAGIIGQEPIRLGEGDLIVFPQGDAHVMSSEPGLREPPDQAYFTRHEGPLPLFQELVGDGPFGARVVCCFLGCDERPFNPLLTALPPVIHLTAQQTAGGPLGALLDLAARESRDDRPGRQNMLGRLSELIFVETIRVHVETLPAGQSGWLGGLRDAIVGGALAALHGQPRHPWTVETLARAAGVSRSVLAERFTEMVGRPPMDYLARWRMQLAAGLLVDGRPVAEVAEAVGYESEAAFSRAFKKQLGRAPSAWRAASTALHR